MVVITDVVQNGVLSVVTSQTDTSFTDHGAAAEGLPATCNALEVRTHQVSRSISWSI